MTPSIHLLHLHRYYDEKKPARAPTPAAEAVLSRTVQPGREYDINYIADWDPTKPIKSITWCGMVYTFKYQGQAHTTYRCATYCSQNCKAQLKVYRDGRLSSFTPTPRVAT